MALFRFLFAIVVTFSLIGSLYKIDPCSATNGQEEAVSAIHALDTSLGEIIQALEGKTTSQSLLDVFKKIDHASDQINRLWLVTNSSLGDYKEYEAIQKKAKKALVLLIRLKQRLKEKHGELGYIANDSFSTSEVVILGLAGETQAAISAVTNIQPGGGCGNWISSVYYSAYLSAASIAEHSKNFALAREMFEKAIDHGGLALGPTMDDATATAYLAYLNLRSGITHEAIAGYQRVLDLYPNSEAASHATNMLTKYGTIIIPTTDRLLATYGSEMPELVSALKAHNLPEFASTIKSLFSRATIKDKIVIAGQLSDTENKEVRDYLKGEFWSVNPDAEIGSKLELQSILVPIVFSDKDKVALGKYLHTLLESKDLTSSELRPLDRALFHVFERGEEYSWKDREHCTNHTQKFVKEWQDWISSPEAALDNQ